MFAARVAGVARALPLLILYGTCCISGVPWNRVEVVLVMVLGLWNQVAECSGHENSSASKHRVLDQALVQHYSHR